MLDRIRNDKELWRQFIKVSLPIAGQNLILFAVSMADTVMVGRLGEVELSAVQLANQLGFFLNVIMFGVSGGANVMIAQYWGKRDAPSIRRVMAIMYRIVAAVTVVFTLVGVLLPRQYMSISSGDAAVIAEGAKFLRILSVGFIAAGFAGASMFVLRSVSNVRMSLVVYTASLIINVFLNWVFIFGNLGSPAMGVAGAAIATVIARLAEAVISLTYLLCKEDQIRYRIKYTFEKASGYISEFRRSALPVVVNETMWGGAMVTVSFIVGRMGTDFTAAYSICMVLGQLVTVAIMGAGNASAVIIGNTVGSGNYSLARSRSNALLFISLVMGVVSMLALLLLKAPFLSLYSVSWKVLEYAGQFMNVHAAVVFCQSVTMVAVIGVLRGGGDARYAAMVDLLPTWLFAIPLGFLSGNVLGLGAPLVYLLIKSDEFVKPVISIFRLLGGKWVNDVTRN